MNNKFEFIVPVTLEQDWATAESIIESIMYLYNEYGFTRFAINGPTGGWRSKHFPPIEHYEMLGRRFAEVREAVAPYGIVCGWWIASTMKSGPSEEFTRMTNHDGTVSAIASCPCSCG